MSTSLQALELLRYTFTSSVRSDAPDLSARQTALLLNVFLGKGPHTVRGLAKDLNISKPAVSRALDRLGELGYIRRERDDLDRRNVLVQRTGKGAAFLNALSSILALAGEAVASIPEESVPDFALEAASSSLAAVGGEERSQAVDVAA